MTDTIRLPKYHVADCIVNVTGPLEGEYKDWPSHIQDRIADALRLMKIATGHDYELYHSMCGHDIDSGYYIHVVARAPVLMQ